jgi:murein DD-endopeptidase MepM/ murein hydrolase activator NlpD
VREFGGGGAVPTGIEKGASHLRPPWHRLLAGGRRQRRSYVIGVLALLLVGVAVIFPFTQKVWAISVDGQVVGWAEDKEQVADLVATILKEDGSPPEAAGRVSYSEVPKRQVNLSAEEDLRKELARTLLGLREGYTITVAGEPLVRVASEADAKAVIEGIKDSFNSGPEIEVKDVTLQEEVSFRAEMVKASEIRGIEEAVTYLLRGTDETKEYEVKSGDSLWSIARAHDLRVADLEKANPGLKGYLQPGQKLNLVVPKPYVNVITQEEKTVTEKIPFETQTVKDSTLYTYEKKVRTPGQAGSKQVTYSIVRQNGQVLEQEVINTVVEKEPVTQVVAVGTKKPTIVGTGSYVWPVSRGGTITSRFGRRGSNFHEGVDIAAPTGTPVLAADDGVVVLAGWKGGYGKCIIVEHGNGSATLYGHLSQILVQQGHKVEKGKTIGLVGSTGKSTGPHLHFEIMQSGVKKNPLNYFTHK